MLPVLPGPPQRQRGLMGRKQGADEKVLSFKARLNEEGVGRSSDFRGPPHVTAARSSPPGRSDRWQC